MLFRIYIKSGYHDKLKYYDTSDNKVDIGKRNLNNNSKFANFIKNIDKDKVKEQIQKPRESVKNNNNEDG